MKDILQILSTLNRISAVSGFEWYRSKEEIVEISPLFSDWEMDEVGNLYYVKKCNDENAPTVLLEAHRDVIGFCVKNIYKGGFLELSPCGGIDPKIVPGSRFTVLSRVDGKVIETMAIGCNLPPHLKNVSKDKENTGIFVDTGLDFSQVIQIGDPVIFYPDVKLLCGDNVTSCGLDNQVGVISLILAKEELQKSKLNLIFLLSAGEETLSFGVKKFLSCHQVDAAIIIDAGFAYSEGLDRTRCILSGGGPSVSVTDTLSEDMTNWVISEAKDNKIPLQIICEPGGTGTSATAVQIQNNGIPSAVVSIPIFNMHTTSEIVSMADVKATVELLKALSDSVSLQEVVLHDGK